MQILVLKQEEWQFCLEKIFLLSECSHGRSRGKVLNSYRCFEFCSSYFFMRDVTYHFILVSDHSPVSVDLNLATLANAVRRTWRFDPTLLKEESFFKTFEGHILTYIRENDTGDVSDSILWEGLKAVIRGHK